jgi:hypothetical protein
LVIVQVTNPVADAVPVQLWAVLPLPSVSVTGKPPPVVGEPPGPMPPVVVTLADSVMDMPFTAMVGLLLVMVDGASVTTKVLDPLLGSSEGPVAVEGLPP